MVFFNFIIIYLNLLLFCNACFPTPTVEPGPTIMCDPTTCPAMMPPVMNGPIMQDSSTCEITRMAKCMGSMRIEYNMNPSETYGPGAVEWTCDQTTMKYTYQDMSSVTQQINTVNCVP
uniref:Secreted protein n=1 Tax=Panagrolaimus superbus TaxID=310955 RepID=A0A914Z4C3_9BILA